MTKQQLQQKLALIRQAIYRGARIETIVKQLNVTISLINREQDAMATVGISKDTTILTTGQVAHLLGLSPESGRVRLLCRDGRIKGQKVGRDVLVSRAAFLDFAALSRRSGRKKAKV